MKELSHTWVIFQRSHHTSKWPGPKLDFNGGNHDKCISWYWAWGSTSSCSHFSLWNIRAVTSTKTSILIAFLIHPLLQTSLWSDLRGPEELTLPMSFPQAVTITWNSGTVKTFSSLGTLFEKISLGEPIELSHNELVRCSWGWIHQMLFSQPHNTSSEPSMGHCKHITRIWESVSRIVAASYLLLSHLQSCSLSFSLGFPIRCLQTTAFNFPVGALHRPAFLTHNLPSGQYIR